MTRAPRPAGPAAVLSLGLLLLYLAFPTKVYYWDGITFAQAIEDALAPKISLVHPNHLLYNFAGYFFYRLLRLLGFNLRALMALQILNSILSAGSAAVLFVILRDLFRSLYLSVCLTLLFSLSATWWKFSTDANAYIASVFFLLVSFFLILPDRKPSPLPLAVAFFAAMCFHELAVLAFPVFALGLYLQDGAISIRRRFGNVILFSVASFALIVTAYALAFYFATGVFDVARLLRWSAYYSPDAETQFNLWSNLTYSLRGEVRLFFGGRLSLLKGLINPAIIVLIGLLIFTALLLIAKALWSLPKLRLRSLRLMPRQKTVLMLALLWVTLYLLFLFFWLPQNTFYRLFYLPALILLLGMALSASEQTRGCHTFVTALFVIAMVLANFLFLIYPSAHVEKYPPLAFALQMNREWPAGTVIYYAAANSDEALVRYFNPETRWQPLPPEFPKDSPAWLETTAIDRLYATAEGAHWLRVHVRPDSLRELNNDANRIRFIQVVP
jgi:hypothetical protein